MIEQQVAVDIDKLFSFIFPKNIQHPLTAGRLFIYSLYGPLDPNNNIRSGYKRTHILKDYELESMCMQLDREDIISTFTENFQELSNEEQSMIIGQSDSKFKIAKGRAMLPTLCREDVLAILECAPRDGNGKLNFHDIQNAINSFRKRRISNMKLLNPPVLRRDESSSSSRSSSRSTRGAVDHAVSSRVSACGVGIKGKERGDLRPRRRDMTNIAPSSMFRKMDGFSNAELTEEVSKHLSRHSFKVSGEGGRSDCNTISNVLLIRDSSPSRRDPNSWKFK